MRRERRLKAIVVAAGMNCLLVCGAQQSQMMKIPDAPDREIDPSLRLRAQNPAMTSATQRAVAAQNEKRKQLIVWASNELVVLSERAEKAAAAPAGDVSKAELAANVNKIEALAKNLALAMKAQ